MSPEEQAWYESLMRHDNILLLTAFADQFAAATAAAGGGGGGGSGGAGGVGHTEGEQTSCGERFCSKRPSRVCSVYNCTEIVPNFVKARVAVCTTHRRADNEPLRVDASPNLVRWCYYCKKIHDVDQFKESAVNSLFGEHFLPSSCDIGMRSKKKMEDSEPDSRPAAS